jgi:hypothetical protein
MKTPYTHSDIVINSLKFRERYTILPDPRFAFSINTQKRKKEQNYFVVDKNTNVPVNPFVLNHIDKKHLHKEIKYIVCGKCGKNHAVIVSHCYPQCSDKARCVKCLPKNIPECDPNCKKIKALV